VNGGHKNRLKQIPYKIKNFSNIKTSFKKIELVQYLLMLVMNLIFPAGCPVELQQCTAVITVLGPMSVAVNPGAVPTFSNSLTATCLPR
jgi:hypothetical protein